MQAGNLDSLDAGPLMFRATPTAEFHPPYSLLHFSRLPTPGQRLRRVNYSGSAADGGKTGRFSPVFTASLLRRENAGGRGGKKTKRSRCRQQSRAEAGESCRSSASAACDITKGLF